MNIVWNEVSCGNLWHFLICPRYAQGWECSNEQDGSIVRFLRSESDQTPEKGLQEGLQQVSSPGSDFGLRGKLSRLHISRQAGLGAQGQVSPAAALQAAPRLVSLQAPRRCTPPTTRVTFTRALYFVRFSHTLLCTTLYSTIHLLRFLLFFGQNNILHAALSVGLHIASVYFEKIQSGSCALTL